MTELMAVVAEDENIREVIVDMLNKNNNITATSGLLGVCRPTLHAWIDDLNIVRNICYVSGIKPHKTDKMLEFEQRYNVDIIDFILHTANKSKQLEWIKEVFEIDGKTFWRWCRMLKIKRKVVWE